MRIMRNFAYGKIKTQISSAITAQLISAFIFTIRMIQFLFFFYINFHDSSFLLCVCRPVCVGPVWKPHCWFSRMVAQFILFSFALNALELLLKVHV